MRLGDLDIHLNCSIIGTCLGTAELRKLIARFLHVKDASDLDVHHEAVRLASQGGAEAKALNKLLDQQHELTLRRFAKAHTDDELLRLWNDALKQGEVPGAYWAVLTHRDVSPDLRQRVFGDVHMLSHLVGAANRADIRRLVALEHDNTELRERIEHQQERSQQFVAQRDRLASTVERQVSEIERLTALLAAAQAAGALPADEAADASANDLVALHTARRERAEQATAAALAEASRVSDERDRFEEQAHALARELAAVENQLRELSDDEKSGARLLDEHLNGRRILYVGGRPSSTPAIRDLVMRHGGEIQRHDGGLEDRKGMLSAAVAWAELVVFPVDCIDHDSAVNLKRLCLRTGTPFLPLRSASVASFAAALIHLPGESRRTDPPGPFCLKHG